MGEMLDGITAFQRQLGAPVMALLAQYWWIAAFLAGMAVLWMLFPVQSDGLALDFDAAGGDGDSGDGGGGDGGGGGD